MPFTKTFHGFIENITDTLLIIEACRNGLLPTINRRLVERERSAIKSGTIIVFDESESGIKRWTDGFLWSPSRILGNFLVYRELANRENRTIEDDYTLSRQTSPLTTNDSSLALLHQRERALVGSLTTTNTTYNFKKNGLLKKTIRIMVNGNYLHIVSYYNKNDVLDNLLPTPSASPQLACLQISTDLMPHLQGFTQNSMSSLSHHHNRAMDSPTRKRSKSSDEQQQQHFHNRERSNYSLPTQQQQTRYYSLPTTTTTTTSDDMPVLSYPSTYFNDHRDYYKTNSTPFTELPPPLPSSDYMTTTTHNNNKKTYNSTSEPLLSPSPSPTPSPPTTLPRVCHQERPSTHQYFHHDSQLLVDANTNSHHFYRSSARPSSTTLDNYS